MFLWPAGDDIKGLHEMPPKVQVDNRLQVLTKRYSSKSFQRTLSDVRTRFCAQVSLAEELLPLNVVRDFYMRHDAYARLALEFPDATVHRDALPWATVRAYRETFAGEPMPSTVAVCMKSAFSRARQVAAQGFLRWHFMEAFYVIFFGSLTTISDHLRPFTNHLRPH